MDIWLWALLSMLILLLWILMRRLTRNKQPTRILAIAGSGGHTTELMRLLSSLPTNLERHYVLANTDHFSKKKILELESKISTKSNHFTYVIPRSREVAQSWISTIFSTLFSLLYCIPVILKSKPDIILCNGPGTCVPICYTALLFKLFGICRGEIIFVESICRVTSMSLSGKLIYPFATKFFIQWPQLLENYPKAIYLNGRIC
uniref:UDP-N-acetylglucosamine transferase subunit ALG14 n=1 Tax=Ciona intestinalis TaxID=7719 RepID=F7BNU5_CIOIN|nr:UDP-N-acetylglucosamine transferase subunit ALG14 homolog [Ciona intestinalis]|eukprot:XP_004226359.1 UDP-N-acetylglucosamine transferase subunit ALG14 homolog [Ciona intestinalis]